MVTATCGLAPRVRHRAESLAYELHAVVDDGRQTSGFSVVDPREGRRHAIERVRRSFQANIGAASGRHAVVRDDQRVCPHDGFWQRRSAQLSRQPQSLAGHSRTIPTRSDGVHTDSRNSRVDLEAGQTDVLYLLQCQANCPTHRTSSSGICWPGTTPNGPTHAL